MLLSGPCLQQEVKPLLTTTPARLVLERLLHLLGETVVLKHQLPQRAVRLECARDVDARIRDPVVLRSGGGLGVGRVLVDARLVAVTGGCHRLLIHARPASACPGCVRGLLRPISNHPTAAPPPAAYAARLYIEFCEAAVTREQCPNDDAVEDGETLRGEIECAQRSHAAERVDRQRA